MWRRCKAVMAQACHIIFDMIGLSALEIVTDCMTILAVGGVAVANVI